MILWRTNCPINRKTVQALLWAKSAGGIHLWVRSLHEGVNFREFDGMGAPEAGSPVVVVDCQGAPGRNFRLASYITCALPHPTLIIQPSTEHFYHYLLNPSKS
jgi:hypothetical protein